MVKREDLKPRGGGGGSGGGDDDDDEIVLRGSAGDCAAAAEDLAEVAEAMARLRWHTRCIIRDDLLTFTIPPALRLPLPPISALSRATSSPRLRRSAEVYTGHRYCPGERFRFRRGATETRATDAHRRHSRREPPTPAVTVREIVTAGVLPYGENVRGSWGRDCMKREDRGQGGGGW